MKYLKTIALIGFTTCFGLLQTSCFGPAVKPGYESRTDAKGELEKKYTAFGPSAVKSKSFTVSESKFTNVTVWYPSDLESTNKSYPVVVFANGSGIINSKYEEVFKHLASWGFIAIGNNDESSWSGYSSDQSLELLLKENKDRGSIFFQKVNTAQIGLSGHSQGGVGVINAFTNQPNGKYYRSIYGASTTKHDLSVSLKWPYEVSKITVPYFAVAGVGASDAGDGKDKNSGIAPLWSMLENYDRLPSRTPAFLARRKNTEHSEMLFKADGYMTAWFLYTLLGDTQAKEAFAGRNAELTTNSIWQDVKMKNIN